MTSRRACAVYKAWSRRAIDLDSSVLVHENVEDFPDSLIQKAFSDSYVIFKLATETDDVGYGAQCRRKRSYWLMFNKKRTKVAWAPWSKAEGGLCSRRLTHAVVPRWFAQRCRASALEQ